MNKRFSRILLGVLALAAVMSLVAAPVRAQSPVTLKFIGWGGPEEKDVFTSLVAKFNAANKDVVIQYEQIPDAYVDKLKTLVAGGNSPDIAYVPDGDFSSFAPLGQLVNIQKLTDASKLIDPKNIWPSALSRYRWDGKTMGTGDLYALPKDIGPTVVFINTDLFAKYNVPLPDPAKPLTWDQVIEIGNKITTDANGKHPKDAGFDATSTTVFGVGDLWPENLIFGNGGSYYSADRRTFVLPDDANGVAAIQFVGDLTHKYKVRPTSAQTSSQNMGQLFEAGKLAMTTNGRWAVTGYRKTLGFKWDVIPNPVGPSGKVTAADKDCTFSGWSGSVGIAIFKGTNGEKNADKAYKFLEFIAGAEGQKEQSALGFQIPNQIDVAKTDAFLQPGQAPANAKVFIEAARCEFAGPWTSAPYFGEWFDPFFWKGAWQEAVIDNVKPVKDAMADRKAEAQKGLDDAWKRFAGGK